MAASITETETKYDAAADVILPRLDGLPGVVRSAEPEEQQLRAEYFDTEDMRLIRAGITLRRRTGGSDAGWHLKLPVGPHSRTEIRLPLGDATREVPAELAELVRARTRNMSLLPVATLTTRRQVTTLLDKAGKSLAEVADDEVTGNRHGDPASITRWREVEVELTAADQGLLLAADRVLREAGMQPAARAAKLERVLGSAVPRQEPEPEVTASALACQVVVAYLRKHADALLRLDPMVRRDEPDAVHQMRIATRRLRSTLRTFGQVVRDQDTERLAIELKWLGGVLGEARDSEVQADRMEEHVRQTGPELLIGPVQARVAGHFGKVGALARAQVRSALNSERYFSLLDMLDTAVAHPPLGPDAQARATFVLPVAIGRSYRRTRRRMRQAERIPSGEAKDAALHQARKAAKQSRYAAEAAEPAFGSTAARFAKQMKSVQSVLGDHQDTVVGRELARQLGVAANLADESSFSYGLFYGREVCRAEALQERAVRVWRRSSRPRYWSWLDAG